jgi:hypothetical protein
MLQDMLLNSLNSLYIHTTALKRRGATPDFLYTSNPPLLSARETVWDNAACYHHKNAEPCRFWKR